MLDIVIRVQNISKQYRIGGPQGRFKYKTIRKSLTEAVQAPFRRAARRFNFQRRRFLIVTFLIRKMSILVLKTAISGTLIQIFQYDDPIIP